LDKILLANSFLDTATCIFLTGEVGLAAVYALDIQVCRVERFSSYEEQCKEYDEVKPFFCRFFDKAIEQNVQLCLPSDFVTSIFFDTCNIKTSKTAKSSANDIKKDGDGDDKTGKSSKEVKATQPEGKASKMTDKDKQEPPAE